jgi:hypothetical protein
MSFFKLKCFSPGNYCPVAKCFIPEQKWDMIVNESEVLVVKSTSVSSATEGENGEVIRNEHKLLLLELRNNKHYFILGTIDGFWDSLPKY